MDWIVGGRQTGKTHRMVNAMLDSDDPIVMVVPNDRRRKQLIRRYGSWIEARLVVLGDVEALRGMHSLAVDDLDAMLHRLFGTEVKLASITIEELK